MDGLKCLNAKINLNLDNKIVAHCIIYHGMATALDEAIGNVTAVLRETGMLDDTLIIFYSE